MKRPALDLTSVALLSAVAGLWLKGADVADRLSDVSRIGRPLLTLLIQGVAVIMLLAAVYRSRALLRTGRNRVLGWFDALEARFEKLPTVGGRLARAMIFAVIVGGLTTAFFEATRPGAFLETRALDVFFNLRFPERSDAELATNTASASARKQNDVIVLALDDDTITHLGWPIPRHYYAKLIDVVSRAKPASLTFDVAFVDPARDHPEWDVAIGEASKRDGAVGFSFALARAPANAVASLPVPMQQAFDDNSIPWQESAAGLPDYSELIGGDAAPLAVIDPIAQSAKTMAMVNVILDKGDDVLRHSLLVARLNKRLLPSLSLRLAAQVLNVPLSDIRIFPGSHVDLGGKRQIPIDRLGRTFVRYQGRHDTHGEGPFNYVSIWSLIRTDLTVTLKGNLMGDDQRFVVDEQTKVTRDGFPVTLAEIEDALLKPDAVVAGKARYATDPGRLIEFDLKTTPFTGEPDFELLDETTLQFSTTVGSAHANHVEAPILTGKHVLVGSTAIAAADFHTSPLGKIPGVEHHATMLANLLHDDFFHRSPPWTNGVIIFAAAFIAAIVGVTLASESGLLLTSLLVLLSLTLSFFAFTSGQLVPIIAPAVSLSGTYLVSLLLGARSSRNARFKAEQDREFVRQTFGRYLTEQVVQQLLDAPDGLRLGGKRAFVTLMMTDLRGFTSMCGTMEPENVVKLLNHYLEAMTRIITRYGGTIDEFIGDAILVAFGAPVPLDQAETRAVACAIEMLNTMPAVNEWNTEQGLPAVEMGIGVHSGEVVLGNIGSELRAKYGIVGATINLTSRVESFTVGGQVLISHATRERCGDSLRLGASQVVSPKGVKGSMTIHEVIGVKAPFEVTLASAAEQLTPPKRAIELRWGHVKGKNVAELTHVAHVEALSEQGLELRVDEELTTLTDLQLRVFDGGALLPGDLYGKVLRVNVRPQVVYLRLTSVPPELKAFLEAARGTAGQSGDAVPQTALVST